MAERDAQAGRDTGGTFPRPARTGRLNAGIWAWAAYDWAISPFSTLIVTFVFAAYFQQGVVGDAVEGQSLWALAMSLAGMAFALTAPFAGAAADRSRALKPWIGAATLACALATAALWFVEPAPRFVALALALVVAATLASEYAALFVNALLPRIAGRDIVGRVSGWSWGLGYIGGLAALLLALGVFIRPAVPPFDLDPATAEQVRITGPLVGAWLALFALPLFLFTPDKPEGGAASEERPSAAVRATLARLRRLPRERDLFRFLGAHLLYNTGLLTLFALGGVYASGVFGMTLEEVMVFGIALNVAAGLGAWGFGFADDRVGSRRAILWALGGLNAAAVLAVLAPDRTTLWVAGIGIGLFVGPVQASSRALIARMAPLDEAAGHFGLFALSGRATTFLGPAAVAAATALTDSQRGGMAAILPFLLLGTALLATVREPARDGEPRR